VTGYPGIPDENSLVGKFIHSDIAMVLPFLVLWLSLLFAFFDVLSFCLFFFSFEQVEHQLADRAGE